jgi:hypothetical protein
MCDIRMLVCYSGKEPWSKKCQKCQGTQPSSALECHCGYGNLSRGSHHATYEVIFCFHICIVFPIKADKRASKREQLHLPPCPLLRWLHIHPCTLCMLVISIAVMHFQAGGVNKDKELSSSESDEDDSSSDDDKKKEKKDTISHKGSKGSKKTKVEDDKEDGNSEDTDDSDVNTDDDDEKLVASKGKGPKNWHSLTILCERYKDDKELAQATKVIKDTAYKYRRMLKKCVDAGMFVCIFHVKYHLLFVYATVDGD